MNTTFSFKDYMLNRPQTPLGQFIKYGICGGLSFLVAVCIIALLNFTLPDYVAREALSAEEFKRNTNIFNTIAFIPSTIVAYITNRLFVFTPGKHHKWLEFLIFCLISTLSYIGGLFGSDWILKTYAVPSYVGSIGFGFSSALINFICRKFIVFKG